jgi:hypothetical protein
MNDLADNQSTYHDNTEDLLRLNSVVDDQYLDNSLHQKYPQAHTSDIVSSVPMCSLF